MSPRVATHAADPIRRLISTADDATIRLMGQSMARKPARPNALTRAMRDSAAFDPSGVAPVAGLRAAVGLVAVLGIGLAAGGPTAAVIGASGALIIGVISLTGGVRPPLTTMIVTALAQAVSIFVGSSTGHLAALHVAILVLWAFVGGLSGALGQGATTVGLQGIVAFVVYSRFAEAPVGALRLAGIALAGAAFQILLTGVVRWPEALRAQRAQLAVLFRALANLARGTPDTSSIPAAEAADAAQQLVSGRSLLARDDGAAMRGVLDEARRIRLTLVSLAGLRRRMASELGSQLTTVDDLLEEAAGVLEGIATALSASDEVVIGRLRDQTDRLSERIRDLPTTIGDQSTLTAAAIDVLASLAGQLRAVNTLVDEIWHSGRPSLQLPKRPDRRDRGWRERTRANVTQLQADLSPRSGAFRHAARLAVLVPATSLVGEYTPLGRGYWIPLTVALVLRSDFSGTFTRGAARTLGTVAGVAIAGVAIATLHPGQPVSILVIGIIAWATYTLFGASYAAFIAGITAIVVMMLGLITPDTISTATDRLIDTLIGGAIALAAYAAWPTWSAEEASAALGDLVTELRRYLRAVFDVITGSGEIDEATMAHTARHARLARSNANAAVGRSLREPSRHRIDEEQTAGVLAALRRVSEAAHLLRTRAAETGVTVPAAAPLTDAIDTAMAELSSTLRGEETPHVLPPLRQLHDRLSAEAGDSDFSRLVDTETDEIVDALDTAGHLLGWAPADTD